MEKKPFLVVSILEKVKLLIFSIDRVEENTEEARTSE